MRHSELEPVKSAFSNTELSEAEQQLMLLGDMFEQIQQKIPQMVASYAAEYGLSVLAWQALKAVGNFGDHATLTAIGESIHASPSTMTGIATRLEQAGLVQRTVSPTDRRAVILQYTPHGQDVTGTIIRKFFGDLTQVVENLDADEMQNILKTFRQILTLIDQMLSDSGGNASQP